MTAGRRAPRLRPDQYLAPHITRRGRFVALDPLEGQRLPALTKVVGVVGWAALAGYTFWQAVRGAGPANRPGSEADAGSA